jgi:hypothetical protein
MGKKMITKLIKTKTFWSGVSLVIYGALTQDWQSILTGLSIIFLRDAIEKKNDRDPKPNFASPD